MELINMKTFAKIAASLVLLSTLATTAFAQTAPKPASNMMSAKPAATAAKTPKASGKKGGYVHATTYTTKKGTVVHRKGTYRHSTKTTKAGAVKKSTTMAKKAKTS
jgi:hypothetical protein